MKSETTAETLPAKHVVLLGIGHTNAHIVRMWGMNPIPDTSLTCISDNGIATYSGMLPAVLAGQVPPEEMEIDLVRLCSFVGARLITSEVTGLDKVRRLVHFADRPSIPFDVLSIGIGSVPSMDGVEVSGRSLLKIKPMQTFLDRLSMALHDAVKRMQAKATADSSNQESPLLKIVVAGSGVAGMEIAFCLPPFLRKSVSVPFSLEVVTRSSEILQGVIPSMRKRVMDVLEQRSIPVRTGKTVLRADNDGLHLNDGSLVEADLIIWATGASQPELLSKLDLPLDGRGFLATNNKLQSTSALPIFAVGDTGTIVTEKLPKAGVYAVRQGPILWENIKATLTSEPLTTYEPQRSFLKLLNTGDGNAIGEWKGFSFGGSMAMMLKKRIDSRFMKMYRVQDAVNDGTEPMQCKGCGCKLGGEVLEGALTSAMGSSATALIKREELDDAAIINTSGGQIVASTDFFSNPFDDPYLAGRVVALHSASDLVAMGASVKAALANVVLPKGAAHSQRQALHELLEGARLEFEAMGGSIVGGHTIVGPRWEVGFTVIGEPLSEALLRKQNLKLGDILYVTKPLGIGVLSAAHMRSQCRARDYQSLIATMLERQHGIAAIAADIGITAGTDITGFGLAGHLIEMLKASNVSATLQLSKLPILPGTTQAIESGIESTLAPDNRHIECVIQATPSRKSRPEYKVLFDPQTSGGLLLGVRKERAARFEQAVSDAGIGPAVAIGHVSEIVAGQVALIID